MNILVLDVAASESGALTILNQFYKDCKNGLDKEDSFIFLLGSYHLEESERIQVINYPEVKKSWLHRIYFDKIKLNTIVKSLKIDAIISLQNIIINNCSIPQFLYMHNALPFVPYKYRINENLKLWTYQNIIKKLIINSIAKAQCTYVQSNWLEKSILKEVPSANVQVCKPNINCEYPQNCLKYTNGKFIYPSTAFDYKNNIAIIEALKLIDKQFYNQIEIKLTLSENENTLTEKLYKEVKYNNLPVKFIGKIEKKSLLNLYSSHNLLFPSYIESYGLPLYEARESNAFILASDTLHSHEILNQYKNKKYFDPFDYNMLANAIVECVRGLPIIHEEKIRKGDERNLFEIIYYEIKKRKGDDL